MLNEKATLLLLIVGLVKRHNINKWICSKTEILWRFKKWDLKNAAGVDTSRYAKKIDLASTKSEVDKLDIDKLEKVATGLNSLKSKVHKFDVD